MEILISENINKTEIKENFNKATITDLLNKKFEKNENLKIEIPKIIAEKFIINVLCCYKNVQEFDVSPIKNGNMHLIKIHTIEGQSLAEVLLTTTEEDDTITISNVITSIKHI